jgi:predicted TIM-barrel fold metal-dependent hydrolase
MMKRRDFLLAAPGVAAAALAPAQDSEIPILDLHQHTRYNGRPDDRLLAHQQAHNVTTTVLLAGEGWMRSIVGGNRDCAAFEALHKQGYVRFTSSDPAESRTRDVLRGNIQRGALGVGEMKYLVAVDSPEMHRVYKLAEELAVPVLIHFEFEMYNTGIERFAAVLKQYPKVSFIGHAQTWWGNVSADLDPLEMYPKGPVKRGGLTDKLLAEYPNLYGDLSAGSGLNAITRDPDFGHDFVTRHWRKLVWGSDCDCHDGRGGGVRLGYCIAERSLATLREYVTDRAKLRRIVWENGAQLLKLKKG